MNKMLAATLAALVCCATPAVAQTSQVLIDGVVASTPHLSADGDPITVHVTQPGAPRGTVFTIGGNYACQGNVSVIGGGGTAWYAGWPTSTGEFTVTRLHDPTGCVLTIASLAGGAPATISFE